MAAATEVLDRPVIGKVLVTPARRGIANFAGSRSYRVLDGFVRLVEIALIVLDAGFFPEMPRVPE